MNKLAILFAGQGSQTIGMGKAFYEKYDFVKEIYEKASNILGYDIAKLCFEENELINQTRYTQPAILVTSIAIYTVLKTEFKIKPDFLAGFSLGEYSALYAANVFDFETIVRLIKKRAELMDEEAIKTPGKMAAIIGLDRDKLLMLCEEVTKTIGLVKIANYNCPNQLVVGGIEKAVLALCALAKENGAKRAIPLNVSGGFHTPLMKKASEAMFDEINKCLYQSPSIDIIMNCNADFLNISKLPHLMKKQIESSVYFEDTIKKMIENGTDTFIEVGPGKVLSGFVRKIDNSKKIISIDKLCDIDEVKTWI